MMKVDFVVSYPYIKVMSKISGKELNKNIIPDTKKWTRDFEKEWRKYEREIFKKIEKHSGLSWKKEEIECFVVPPIRGMVPFSPPLTILLGDKEKRLRTLIHELIHTLFFESKLKKLRKKSKNPRIFEHAALYLIFDFVVNEVFPNEDNYFENEKKIPMYKKSIEISNKLRPKWEKFDKNIYEFMKYCLKECLVE